MRLNVEVVAMRSAVHVGLLVTNAATREPLETLHVCPRSEVIGARARLLDRWASEPTVLSIDAPAIPAWALSRPRDLRDREGCSHL
jgi:hypothetical protein